MQYDPIAMPEHFLFVFAGVAFLVEYLMNGKGFVGLAKLEHSLFGGLTIVCAAACFCLSIRLSAFIAISCCRLAHTPLTLLLVENDPTIENTPLKPNPIKRMQIKRLEAS
ncbi:APC membrane recruitment protein like protein, partial [Tanacetum coccineum]